MNRLVAILLRSLLALTPLGPLDSWAVTSARSEACGTCDGAGAVWQTCTTCNGKGKARCIRCKPLDFTFPISEEQLFIESKTKTAAEIERLAQARKELERIAKEAARGMEELQGVVAAGKLPCQRWCREGKAGPDGFPCRYCDEKGSLKCPSCRSKGEWRCGDCAGKKKELLPCPECSGSRSAPALDGCAVDRAPQCPWCEGREIRPCQACSEENTLLQSCSKCAATGRVPCRTCRDTKRVACRPCSSSGLVSTFGMKLEGKKPIKCSTCRGKGYSKCGHCKRDGWPCRVCSGAGEMEFACPACYGSGTAVCRGCWRGSSRAWESAGQRLLEAGRTSVALAYLQEGLRREQVALDAATAGFEGAAKERAARLRPHEERIKSFEKLVKLGQRTLDEESGVPQR